MRVQEVSDSLRLAINLFWLSPIALIDQTRREPDEYIGGKADPYMKRWFLSDRAPGATKVYLHEFHRSDDDRALHDHPADSASVMLRGMFLEWTFSDGPGSRTRSRLITAGDIGFRRAEHPHRIELIPQPDQPPPLTLFIFGPKIREWGFWCASGWRHWRDYAHVVGKENTVGRGCD